MLLFVLFTAATAGDFLTGLLFRLAPRRSPLAHIPAGQRSHWSEGEKEKKKKEKQQYHQAEGPAKMVFFSRLL